jgi:hypothetical protein
MLTLACPCSNSRGVTGSVQMLLQWAYFAA